MSRILAGIDLGGTNIKIGCFDSALNLINKKSIASNANEGPGAVIEKMVAAVKTLLAQACLSQKDLVGVGVGTPGAARYKEGIIIASPNLPLFKNVPVKKMLADKLTVPVIVENDANAACWGEYILGAGVGINDMVFFTLGTGIGGGIISGGRLVRGCGGNAAELGHIIIYPGGRGCGCGQKGCAEAYASANSTAKRATEAIQNGAESSLKKILKKKKRITSKDVYEHLASGDNLAKEITDGTAEALAILCINMLHATEPRRIVFAGGMIAAGEPLLKRIKDFFNEYIWLLKAEPVEICFAKLGEDAGIIGAAALARQIDNESE